MYCDIWSDVTAIEWQNLYRFINLDMKYNS